MATSDMSTKSANGSPLSTIQFLSLGMPKTGTASLAAAYRILGYNAHHGITAIEDAPFWPRYERACDATFHNIRVSGPRPPPLTRADWDVVWGHGVETMTDLAPFFGPQLVKAYPELKVILCERDIDRWYNSLENAALTPMWSWMGWAQEHIIEPATGLRGLNATKKAFFGKFKASTVDEIRAHARDTFIEHYKMIKEMVPPEQLLVYQMGQGWEPICKFLDRPVPDVEFPRVHETEEAKKIIADKIKKDAMTLVQNISVGLLKYGLIVGVGVIAWSCVTKM